MKIADLTETEAHALLRLVLSWYPRIMGECEPEDPTQLWMALGDFFERLKR